MNPLILLALQEAPAIINRFIELFKTKYPAEPVPTSEQVIAAYHSAFLSSLLKDDMWRAAHPVKS